MYAAVNFALQQAGGFQDAEMLGNGGKGNGKRCGEFGDRSFTAREAGQNGAANGIGESAEGGVEQDTGSPGRGIGIVNHMV
jgi:hypothetical protein